MSSPFEQSDVINQYDDWFRTPYGRLVDRIEIELILDCLGSLDPGASLVDIGCRTGWFGRELRGRGFRVTGVDLSHAMLLNSGCEFPVVRGDAARLPFADHAFDAACLIAVLDFVPDAAAVLREARRVVRRRLAVTALVSGSWLGLRRKIAARRGHRVFSVARFYSRHRLLDFAREAGAVPECGRGALFLPLSIAAAAAYLELALRGRTTFGAGIVAFSLPATISR